MSELRGKPNYCTFGATTVVENIQHKFEIYKTNDNRYRLQISREAHILVTMDLEEETLSDLAKLFEDTPKIVSE